MQSFINYTPDCDFPIENLPYGVFSTSDDVSHNVKIIITILKK